MSSARLEAVLADAGLAPAEQAELSDLLLPLVVTTDLVPEPSAELAVLFRSPIEGGHLSTPVIRAHAVRRWRVRTASVGAVVLAVSSVGATGLSAAANSLPSAVQHHVSQFSRHYLPFDFPEPPEQTDQPLGEGRSALAPESTPPRGVDERSSAAGGVVGIEPPPFLVGADRPSQTGPFLLAPPQESSDRQQVRTSGHQGHPAPSAAPSPAAAPSPSASPSLSADEAEEAVRSASPSPSPTPMSATSHPDKGSGHAQAGGYKPGTSEDPGLGKRPVRTSGSGDGPVTASGSGSSADSDQGDAPDADDDGASETAKPTTPEPSIVVRGPAGLGDLPDVPFTP